MGLQMLGMSLRDIIILKNDVVNHRTITIDNTDGLCICKMRPCKMKFDRPILIILHYTPVTFTLLKDAIL